MSQPNHERTIQLMEQESRGSLVRLLLQTEAERDAARAELESLREPLRCILDPLAQNATFTTLHNAHTDEVWGEFSTRIPLVRFPLIPFSRGATVGQVSDAVRKGFQEWIERSALEIVTESIRKRECLLGVPL